MEKKISIFILLILIFHSSFSQKIGGGELNPGIYTNEESLKRFQDMRFGLSIHWGPNSVAGKEISWSRGDLTPKEEYDNFYKQFNPTKFNADEWVKLIQDFGMKYVSITAKHHDGFTMWNSDYSDYDIAATPFKRDIVKELSDACQKKGIVFGTYYSILDWYHPDYQPYGHGGAGNLFQKYNDTPNLERYTIYMKNQLRELIQKYNTQIIQFDGEFDTTFTHRMGSDLYVYLRKLNDKVLINNRTDKGRYTMPRFPDESGWRPQIYAGDFEERERYTTGEDISKSKILGKSSHPWQAWISLDKSQWSWKTKPRLLNYQEVVKDLLKTIGDNGNYIVNMAPSYEGGFNPEAIATMTKVGNWVKQHSTAIYDTRGGDFVQEGIYTSTRKGNTINLFVFDTTLKTIELSTNENVLKIQNEKKVMSKFKQLNNSLSIEIGQAQADDFVRVFTIQLQ
jgi:alpha-L-fucosidase